MEIKHIQLGRTGVTVPAIGQGTFQMGEDKSRLAQEVEALRTGIEAGMTLIDTAEMYADGGSERVVGEAISDCRDQVFLVTKVWPTNADYQGVLNAASNSLKRLGTDYIDLYLLHWPSADHPIDQTMKAMNKLADDGAVRFVGVSNFSPELIEEAQNELGERLISANQVGYHLQNRVIEKTLLPYCQQQGITVMAYSPFGKDNFPKPGTEGRRVLDTIAEAHGKTAHQVALNWVIRLEGVLAIPKASNPDHARQNGEAADFTLTTEELEAIDKAFPAGAEEFEVRRL